MNGVKNRFHKLPIWNHIESQDIDGGIRSLQTYMPQF